MLEYLKNRVNELAASGICERIRAAAADLENAVAGVSAAESRLRPIAGKWNIAETVDHISQTQIRGTEELRHLLSGRRPPLPPVYEALRSGAGEWASWDTLVSELKDANRAMIELLESAPNQAEFANAPTVRTVVVALRKLEDGSTAPQLFFAD